MKKPIKLKKQIYLFVFGLLFSSFTHLSLASPSPAQLNHSDEQQATEQDSQLAETAIFLGENLSNQTSTSDITSYFRSQALNKMNGEIEGWLKQFGNARARMELDEKFTLKNYEFDLLIPLIDKQEYLFFTQGSLHREEDRTQTNLGFGLRYYPQKSRYMLGTNLFWDYDMSRFHQRLGIGLEYWRDYLKLAANGYFRNSDWIESPNVTDYNERPASGWDLHLDGYLPNYPQLGGKLSFEQYYGDDVGLFGKNKRQKDPYAITFGVTYTPIPLITAEALHSQGKSGENDTRINFNLNYRMGIPFAKQLSPETVNQLRLLSGNRYDFVERNNNIVLEYQKQELLKLRTADFIVGNEKEEQSLQVNVKSKYAIDHLEWSASELINAGGKLFATDKVHYNIILPTYQSSKGINEYTIQAIAIDEKGNRSNREETKIKVLKDTNITAILGEITPKDSTLMADTLSQRILKLTLTDNQGIAADIPLSDVTIKETHTSPHDAKISELIATGKGTYEFTVTAGTLTEVLNFTAQVKGNDVAQARVTILSAIPDKRYSKFEITPETIPADNITTTTLTFTAFDKNNKPVTGIADGLTFVIRGENGETIKDDNLKISDIKPAAEAHIYQATLKGIRDGKFRIEPHFMDEAIGELNDVVTLTPVLAYIKILPHPEKVKVGESIPVTVLTKNMLGNPMPNVALKSEIVMMKNRKGIEWQCDNSSKQDCVKFNNETYALFKIQTNAEGKTNLVLTQPKGAGIKTTFRFIPAETLSHKFESDESNVIFTNIHSPDSSFANMYGHMQDTVTLINGTLLKRAPLDGEISTGSSTRASNEDWATGTLQQTMDVCGGIEYLFTGNQGGEKNDRWAINQQYSLFTDIGWNADEFYIAWHSNTPSPGWRNIGITKRSSDWREVRLDDSDARKIICRQHPF